MALEQEINSASAAMLGTGRAEGEHLIQLLQPELHFSLEYGTSLVRTVALTVNDPGMTNTAIAAHVQKVEQGRPCFCHRQAMQIQFSFRSELAAPQFTQHTLLNAGAGKADL